MACRTFYTPVLPRHLPIRSSLASEQSSPTDVERRVLIPPEFTITLQFEGESRVHGANACNRYFGECHRDGSHLRFHQIGTTRMMCSEPAMALESEYFAALEHVETYQLQADRLALYYDQGKSLLLFRNGVAS
jgi:heat shock protein HslJ